MKKVIAFILLTSVILCSLVIAPMTAMADGAASGSTERFTAFRVESLNSNAYIVLSSSTGLVNVAQHNWIGQYTGNGNETSHGFYHIGYCRPGQSSCEVGVWAPSATTNTGNVTTCTEMVIYLPEPGIYTITVDPMTTGEAAKYWRVDSIDRWIHPATWRVTIMSGCRIV